MSNVSNLSGLKKMSMSSLVNQGGAVQQSVMQIALSKIEEDPDNARQASEFTTEDLMDMAESIIEHGVLVPVCVRNHPDDNSRYILNYGARRFRGSQIAKKETIPAIINNDFTPFSKMIENVQRKDLSLRSISKFIADREGEGLSKTEIAKKLGKPNSWVTRHTGLHDAPEIIQQLMDNGQLKAAEAATTLINLYRERPEVVTSWIQEREDKVISQLEVRNLARMFSEQEQINEQVAKIQQKHEQALQNINTDHEEKNHQEQDQLNKETATANESEPLNTVVINSIPASSSDVNDEDENESEKGELDTKPNKPHQAVSTAPVASDKVQNTLKPAEPSFDEPKPNPARETALILLNMAKNRLTPSGLIAANILLAWEKPEVYQINLQLLNGYNGMSDVVRAVIEIICKGDSGKPSVWFTSDVLEIESRRKEEVLNAIKSGHSQ